MFPSNVYKNRRDNLRKQVKSGIILFPGNNDVPYNYPANTYAFRQDSHFLYFFGLNNPGFTAVIDIDNSKEYIFANDVDLDDIIWMGKQPLISDLAASVGVENSSPLYKLDDFINLIK